MDGDIADVFDRITKASIAESVGTREVEKQIVIVVIHGRNSPE